MPPDIINEESSTDISVQEGEDAVLTCRATGHPQPRVTWRREDNDYIYIRTQKSGNRDLSKGKISFISIYYLNTKRTNNNKQENGNIFIPKLDCSDFFV